MSNNEPIPGYSIQGKLGAGGMGLVFKARDLKNDRLVALKILYPKTVQNQTELARFGWEAQLLIKFEHPNLVKGYQVAHYKELYFLAMEYVDGKSAGDLLGEKGFLPEDLALNIILQTARALDYIEKQGILHRDVKPANLLLTKDNTVKLCDLGFALPISGQLSKKASDRTVGTPQYMSPEQAKGEMSLDIRSDIYSLGATFYHLVTGKLPFTGTDNMEVMAQQVLADLQSDEIKNRHLSPLTLYFIEKMMVKEKEIRYQNPAEVIEDIENQTTGYRSLEYQRPSEPPPADKPKSSRLAEIRKQLDKKKKGKK